MLASLFGTSGARRPSHLDRRVRSRSSTSPTVADDSYILKSIPYDPVNRLDLTTLPQSTPQQTTAFVRSKPISRDTPWIMQALVNGQEYCTHSTVRDGRVQAYCCCESSAFQINYEMVDKPEIEAWVTAIRRTS